MLPLIITAVLFAGCHGSPPPVADQVSDTAKIRFRLDDIRPDGLRGPPDGLVAVAYEFCVPTGERVYRDMMQIDPGLQVQPGARGRIACAHDQSLVTGTTNQTRWREVLQALSSLDYVSEIRECFFE